MTENLKYAQNVQKIEDIRIISDPNEILVVLHDQKMRILLELQKSMKNIQDLVETTKLNPGTIKRHLDELIKYGFVFVAEIRKNDYKMTMKYYQATARSFEIRYEIQGTKN
jgi:predicted ArsR family transcriptional regulator